jgi:hypothetical protein
MTATTIQFIYRSHTTHPILGPGERYCDGLESGFGLWDCQVTLTREGSLVEIQIGQLPEGSVTVDENASDEAVFAAVDAYLIQRRSAAIR